ncbi:MAG: hypothetical protein KGZ83_16520 [Sulfuricella sp.]|nr:hypothetical protein [Sulfuricella sp.]
MRIEVHVHGSLFFCKGVTPTQVENGLHKWLEYMDVENIGEMRSMERAEPGVTYDRAERVLDICWTGEVGHSFQQCLHQTLLDLGPLLSQASEIELTYFHDEEDQDEYQILFAGPTPEAIHRAQRQRMVEDVAGLLSRHFSESDVGQVSTLVNQLFDKDWETRLTQEESEFPSSGNLIHFRHKHLH